MSTVLFTYVRSTCSLSTYGVLHIFEERRTPYSRFMQSRSWLGAVAGPGRELVFLVTNTFVMKCQNHWGGAISNLIKTKKDSI